MKTATAKEQADKLRANAAKTDYPIATREEARQIAAALDRLARYDAATPEEVAEIKGVYAGHVGPIDGYAYETQCILTLLAVVARQGAEIERLTAIRDARVQDLSNADEAQRLQRLEIERLKSALSAYERPLDDAELLKIEGHARYRRQDVPNVSSAVLVHWQGACDDRDILLAALRRERAEKEALRAAALDVAACLDGRDEQTLFLRVPVINGARAVENLRTLLNQQHGHLATETGKS